MSFGLVFAPRHQRIEKEFFKLHPADPIAHATHPSLIR